MNRQRIIYSLTLPNDKVYVGQTVDFRKRMYNHKYDSSHPKRRIYNYPLNRAIRKYGWDKVKKKIEHVCSYDSVDKWERFYIQVYNSLSPNGYNLEGGGCKNKVHSEETIRKMRESHKNISEETREKLRKAGRNQSAEKREKISEFLRQRPVTDETRLKLSKARRGKHLSDETKRKIGEKSRLYKGEKHWNYGKHRSEETRRKISEAAKNISEETRQKMRIAKIGKPLSLDHKQKISEKLKAYWANKKGSVLRISGIMTEWG